METFRDKRRIGLVCALLAAFMLAVAACGGDDEESGSDGAVEATLGGDAGEFAITLDPESTAAGPVLFNVTNSGESEHEFEVFMTDVAPEEIPVADGAADMESVEAEEINEVEDLEPGATSELEVELEAGTYLIICNLPAHFEQGMHAGFTVE